MQVIKPICIRCNIAKYPYEYHRDKRRKENMTTICKECYKAAKRPTELDLLRKRLPEGCYDINSKAWGRIKRED